MRGSIYKYATHERVERERRRVCESVRVCASVAASDGRRLNKKSEC
jgi:hypothetical protein